MNVYTGLKEARLNIPMEGEEVSEEYPMEQAMVIVEQPEEEAATQQALRDQVPEKPPAYDAAGKIPPPPPNEGGDIGNFHKAMLDIKTEGQAFDSALDDLSELSHDIYYGVELAKDGRVLQKLTCLVLGFGSQKFPATEEKRDHKAAAILASAIQNNPTALKEVAKMSRIVMYPTCVSEATVTVNFVDVLRVRLSLEKEPSTLKAKVSAISGLLREPTIRKEFLENRGMKMLLEVWLKKGEEFDSVRMKVAQLVMDNFLDESMGAALGVWPKQPVRENKICETKGRTLEDGCWEYHVDGFAKAYPGKVWAGEFLKALGEQRAKWGDSIQDREL